MAAEYMHIGIPVLNKKEGMTYNEAMKFWVNSVDDYDLKIKYLKSEEGTPFPEIFLKQPRVTCKVDGLDHYAASARQMIFGPLDLGLGVRLVFVIRDDATIELYEEK